MRRAYRHARLDINPVYDLSLGAGLLGHQGLAEQFRGSVTDSLRSCRKFYTTGLAAAAGLNLRFDRERSGREFARVIASSIES